MPEKMRFQLYSVRKCSVTNWSHTADGKLFHTVGSLKAKPRRPVDVRTLVSWMHPVDVDSG